MSNLAAYSDVISNRENMYLFLTNLYKTEVTESFYKIIRDLDFSAEPRNELSDGYEKILSFCRAERHDPITDLAVDYARIFLGAGSVETEKSAFPYESVYTSEKRLIMQEARDEVLALYRKYGLGVSSKYSIPEDHLALELEFMAHLCGLVRQAAENGKMDEAVRHLGEQREFHEKHLMRWVPDFCKDINKVASTAFYQGVAELTVSFLNMDAEIVNDLLVSLQQEQEG
ncbi:hypothetical protein EP073_04165 [Geovibrio thiophilus]|uniref:Molecular chaperone TorD n=1 Tax=Geovibrio thiophilus TaxID=139438 RepID=A0A3R5Y678_9BACT|nr:molecular chaperone TorD family protein [Geovibrio thiophilus]QAR32630.1 hypothetical protein EP073_04165 [Geovibrio thiophilus]